MIDPILPIELMIELTIKIGGEKMLGIIKSKMIKEIPSRLIAEVPNRGHFIRLGDSEKNVSFCVRFIKTYPIPLKITSIDYAVSYENQVIQQRQWQIAAEMKRWDKEG
jgi:hypothetical protein